MRRFAHRSCVQHPADHRPTVHQLVGRCIAPSSQLFILIGTLFILPIILMHNCWSYFVFRGKVRIGDGSH